MELGVVPGGGMTLCFLSSLRDEIVATFTCEDEIRGADIVFKSLVAPVCQIAKNSGLEGQVVLSKVIGKPFGYGFNAATGEYGDLVKMGVIDPAKVTIAALENSASIAGLVLTTEALICDVPVDMSEDEKMAALDRGAGMGGMDYF